MMTIRSNAMTAGRKLAGKSKLVSQFAKILGGIALLGSVASAVAAVPPVTTQGNQVLFGGQAGGVSGVSFFWSNTNWGGDKYYTPGVTSWLRNDWNAKIVRAAMGVEDDGGYLKEPAANLARVKAVVDAAIANDMYVIIDWHTHHAEWNAPAAVAFFTQMAQTYKGVNNVIFEIYNEPLNTVTWSGVIKPYALPVINAIRSAGANNLIVVGTSSWSQDVDQAANDPITGYANIAYTLHFYVGSHFGALREKAQGAINRGLPLFVTEWGIWGSCIGCVDWSEMNAWKNFMLTNKLSNAAWGLTDKFEESSFLTAGASTNGGWTSNQITNAGNAAKDLVVNWPALAGGTSSSSASSAANVGDTIQAENYAEMSGIKTETTSDTGGGSNVGYIDAGDWMKYPVNIPTAGKYLVTYRVASMNGGGVLQLENAGGTPSYGSINVPSTGGWQTWVNVSQVVTLPAGNQNLAIAAITGGFNLNWFKIEPVNQSSAPTTSSSAAPSSVPTVPSSVSSSSSSASNVTPIVTFQAEAYSYMSGIQTEATTDVGGGLNVGWIDAGDWLSFVNSSVTIPQTGTYTIEFRVASQSGGGSLSFEEAGGLATYATVTIPSTGGWQNWTTVKTTVNLTAGVHKFGIGAKAGGWNFNWFSITQGVK